MLHLWMRLDIRDPCYKLEMFTCILLLLGKWNVIFFCVYDIITRLSLINPPLCIFPSICSMCHAIKTPVVEMTAIVRICVQPIGHVPFWYSSFLDFTFFKIHLLTGERRTRPTLALHRLPWWFLGCLSWCPPLGVAVLWEESCGLIGLFSWHGILIGFYPIIIQCRLDRPIEKVKN